MTSFLDLNQLYELHQLDSSLKGEGVFIVDHKDVPTRQYAYSRHQFEGLLLGFVLRGTMKTQVHFSEYEVHQGDVILALPHLMIDVIAESEDIEIITIGLSLDFISSIPHVWEFVNSDKVRLNPLIHFHSDKQDLQREFIVYLQKFYHSNLSDKKNEILRHHILALIHMVVEAHREEENQEYLLKDRSATIIDKFYTLVSKYAVVQRDIGFYADKLNLTAPYLTTLLAQKTGKSALKWIDHVVILQAKSLLKTTDLSVKEISNRLNFNDASLFCRYFKRHTTLSPNGFRRQL
ncbi:AraC family transcriptional regulator [Myroides sp. 1354]|uniref:AraC family transcriptional regulator n=1 Tax=unclassified Myroides TaxID=2642485 RepID=UPI002576A540|nr:MULTISPECIES: helix-turn-helix domain-containing protein [unclassified Myroides]MDM1044836.1 AraC family transcriptional regulator [Myroides sp. R163-1]MDM1055549.1 AraC family transcriptional regulator [Myroides sp. 1354]MDM1068846.1 AraC family transcriptional regulator [Myroides sp. 1372]